MIDKIKYLKQLEQDIVAQMVDLYEQNLKKHNIEYDKEVIINDRMCYVSSIQDYIRDRGFNEMYDVWGETLRRLYTDMVIVSYIGYTGSIMYKLISIENVK